MATSDVANDRQALEALYQAADGTNWINNGNWLSDRPLDEWCGLETDEDGRVIGLFFDSNGLAGQIPAEVGQLNQLVRLHLADNQLEGAIPSQLGSLVNLTECFLGHNELVGEIPASLGELTNLEKLFLVENKLTGQIPAELGNLSNIEELSLENNQLTGEVPADLGKLQNLTHLWLATNNLTGRLPSELGNLTQLEVAYLAINRFNGPLPAELGNLDNLTELWLGGNRLTGCLPNGLTDVGHIDLNLTPCSDRDALEALYNSTSGANWTNDANWLSDKALDEWYGVTTNSSDQIVRLDLSNNRLNGEIPVELGNMSNLAALFLFGNSLDGEIPAQLSKLSNLKRLFIGGNRLGGCIPDGLKDVPNNDLIAVGLPLCGLTDADTSVASISLAVFSTSPGQMNLTWSSGMNDVTHQEIFRDGDSIATAQPGRTWFAESGLAPNTRYEYRVEFQLADGSTVNSEAVNIATLAEAPLITPMNVTETAITVAIVDTMNPEETTYRVTLSDVEGTVISNWGSSRCRTIENLQTGVGYQFEVVTRNPRWIRHSAG